MNTSRSILLAAAWAFALTSATTSLEAHQPQADVVADWNETGVAVLLAATPPLTGVHLAMMHAAIFDAVNAIDKHYKPFGVSPKAPVQGASREAAAASAAYHLLKELAPGQASTLDAAYAKSLQAVPNGVGETRGVVIGKEVAAGWIALRTGDGRDAVVPYTFGSGPGVYQATPPAFGNPVNTFMPGMKPFVLERASQFRAYGPPDLTSAQYAADVAMVRELGSATSTKRTAEETEIALFHTENPNLFWSRNLRNFAKSKRLDVADNARLYALLFVGINDATQACFDSKYYYDFWRPVTAIAAADTDDNPATEADPSWTPLAVTPPHPEYPAAHGCVAGVVAETLNRFFGSRQLKLTFTSTVPGSVPHVYFGTDDLVEEIIVARVYGGMHYPTSVIHGATLGRAVAKWIDNNSFQPIRNDKSNNKH
jgi:hypothetical protein